MFKAPGHSFPYDSSCFLILPLKSVYVLTSTKRYFNLSSYIICILKAAYLTPKRIFPPPFSLIKYFYFSPRFIICFQGCRISEHKNQATTSILNLRPFFKLLHEYGEQRSEFWKIRLQHQFSSFRIHFVSKVTKVWYERKSRTFRFISPISNRHILLQIKVCSFTFIPVTRLHTDRYSMFIL